MREIEEALAVRLCKAGTSKDAILTAFRAAICNGTSLTDELAGSGAAAEAAIARATAAHLRVAFAAIPEGATIVASSAGELPGPRHSRRLMVVTNECEVLCFAAPTLAETAGLKNNLSLNPDSRGVLRIPTLSQFWNACVLTMSRPSWKAACPGKVWSQKTPRASFLAAIKGIVAGGTASFVFFGLILYSHELFRA